MAQIDMDGNEESQPLNDTIWVRIQALHSEGRYSAKDAAQTLLDEDYFPQDWKDGRLLQAAVQAVEAATRCRNSDGSRRGVKVEGPYQYRIFGWCTFDDLLGDLAGKLSQWRNDSEAIKLDAGVIMRKFPANRRQVLAILPPELRPATK